MRCSTSEGVDSFSNSVQNAGEAGSEERWDDFSDETIKKTFECVLSYKKKANFQDSTRVGNAPKEFCNLNSNVGGYVSLTMLLPSNASSIKLSFYIHKWHL